ncbi:acyl carrier protein [Streptacidiphilus sp. N1-10]|uniref:Acyl carrier protein n=1 Tax=Streptacidiphilus jeojiensis TaxID=3229225 RepID=A0ABV6XNA2_9ACTN
MALSEREILEGLAEIVNEETGIPTHAVRLGQRFAEDLAIDGSQMAAIIQHIGDKFRVTVPADGAETFKKIGDTVAYIQAAQG